MWQDSVSSPLKASLLDVTARACSAVRILLNSKVADTSMAVTLSWLVALKMGKLFGESDDGPRLLGTVEAIGLGEYLDVMNPGGGGRFGSRDSSKYVVLVLDECAIFMCIKQKEQSCLNRSNGSSISNPSSSSQSQPSPSQEAP